MSRLEKTKNKDFDSQFAVLESSTPWEFDLKNKLTGSGGHLFESGGKLFFNLQTFQNGNRISVAGNFPISLVTSGTTLGLSLGVASFQFLIPPSAIKSDWPSVVLV